MYKKILSLFTILFIISAIAAPVYADQTVFGPEDLTIGQLYVHLSSHQFSVDDPSDGVFTIVKNTPDKEIWVGFCVLNGKYISLSDFLNGTGTIFEEDVDLRSNSRITIFLGGTPDASIKVEVKKKGVTPPPEVAFTADPATIYVGQSSTLSWTSSNADTCVIEPGIGSVDLNGSTTVSPIVTTTYSITATGLGGTATTSTTVTIANSEPVANDQTVTLNEDETVSITLTASDANGDALTFEIVSNPSHGTLTGSAPNLTYTPSPNYNGSDSFTFKANDGSLDSNTATITMSIQPVNDIPIAVDDTVTTNEDTAITVIAVLANDTDPDGDTLNISDFTQPSHGTAGSNGDGTLTYTPNADFNGTDSFTYTVSDGNGGIDTATVNITINPVNDAPVANDQTVTLNEDETASITLTASDVDGDALTYQIVSNPTNGALTGSAPNLTYTPAENYNGSDEFTFRANDGTIDSADATVTVTINPVNDPPVANAGSDQTALQGNVVTLNGNGSSDIDGDPLKYNWSFISVPTGSTATLSDSSIVNPNFTADAIGTYEVQLIVNGSTIDSVPDTVTVNIVALPTVEISANPVTILAGESSSLTWTSTNADTCVIEPGVGSVALNGSVTVSPTETTTYTITATGAGGTASASVTITVNQPPTVNFSASPATIAKGGSSQLTWTSVNAQSAHIDNGIGTVNVNGSTTVSPEHTTTYTITVTGSTGSASSKATVKVTGNPETQPEGSFGDQYEDLVPPDSTVDEYDPNRFSLITGIVHAIDDSPIQDVSITIHSHPEYGTVSTDATGSFSIPVEGGGTMTVVYQKNGLITSHRKVYVPWNEIAIAEIIQMIAQDPVSTTLTFDDNPATMVTHQSTEVTDEFGSRSFSMVFAGDNSAWLMDEDGNDVQPLETISVRASEYTTENSMPAKLPPNSAYTYCVELAVDGAERVRFEEPVITWINNFLGFDVGMVVPVGYYDRDRGVWVPSDNGVVVSLLDTDSDGIVDALDADGDDQPDDLNSNGSFSDEVTGLGDNEKYAPDATFWRVAITHFSPWDCNWPYGPPDGATGPNPPGLPSHDTPGTGGTGGNNGSCSVVSSYISHLGRIYHEDIPIPGTDMALHYSSNRVEGYQYKITVPVSGDTVPGLVERIIVRVEIAGRTLRQELPDFPNQNTYFIWDGLDYLGRRVKDPVTAEVFIEYIYPAIYRTPWQLPSAAFSQPGFFVTQVRARQEMTLGNSYELIIQPYPAVDGGSTVSDGWTISSHHQLSATDPSTLHKGDGQTVNNNLTDILATVAGGGDTYYYYPPVQTGPALEAHLNSAADVEIDAKGNLYIADGRYYSYNVVWKVDTSGNISIIAGSPYSFHPTRYGGDGGPATEAWLAAPHSIAVDNSGNLYIAEFENCRVRKVDTNGIITTVAGNGTCGYSGDSGPATEAMLARPSGVAVDTDGNLYIAHHSVSGNGRIRKVDPNGIITTVAGNGTAGYSGDGGLATEAQIHPTEVAVDTKGNIYITQGGNNSGIRKIDTSGIITTVAGGQRGYSGDGGPATEAELEYPADMVVDEVGNIYIADGLYIRKVDTTGIITTLAGTETAGYTGDGGPATEARITNPAGVILDAKGALYFSAKGSDSAIRKIGPPSVFTRTLAEGGFAFAEENGLGYILSESGQHKTTIDLDTGVTLKEFGYDQDNNLISITDQFNNQVIIQRDANGTPTSITSPDGLTTTLTIDGNNHLTRITHPDSSFYSFEYASNGLMTTEIEPEGNRFDHTFDLTGKLTDAYDEAGGHWNYTRNLEENGDILTEVTTGEGNVTSYLDRMYSTGAFDSTITDPTGAQTLFSQSADGLTVNKSLSCGMSLEYKFGFDSEYWFNYLKEITETTPSGLEKVTLINKTYQGDVNQDDIPDLITQTFTANGKITTSENNTIETQKRIISPEGRIVTTQYDSTTLLTESESIPGLNTTNFGYDSQGRKTSISFGSQETTFFYNSQGFMDSYTNPEGYTTTYTHDPVGRVTGIGRPDGSSLGFAYDGNGNMTVLTNPSSIQHGFGFNAVNLNSSYQTPLSVIYQIPIILCAE